MVGSGGVSGCGGSGSGIGGVVGPGGTGAGGGPGKGSGIGDCEIGIVPARLRSASTRQVAIAVAVPSQLTAELGSEKAACRQSLPAQRTVAARPTRTWRPMRISSSRCATDAHCQRELLVRQRVAGMQRINHMAAVAGVWGAAACLRMRARVVRAHRWDGLILLASLASTEHRPRRSPLRS
jgi:hypothetical protein